MLRVWRRMAGVRKLIAPRHVASVRRRTFASVPEPPLPQPIDANLQRTGTGSRKWTKFKDAIPLWVADMDFHCPQPVVNAVKSVAEHGVYGYADPSPRLGPAVVDALCKTYGFDTVVDANSEDAESQRAAVQKMIRWLPGLLPVSARLVLSGKGTHVAMTTGIGELTVVRLLHLALSSGSQSYCQGSTSRPSVARN